MYFDLTLYRLMLQLAWSEPRLRPRLTALFVALVFIPLYSVATALFYLLDKLLRDVLVDFEFSRVPDAPVHAGPGAVLEASRADRLSYPARAAPAQRRVPHAPAAPDPPSRRGDGWR